MGQKIHPVGFRLPVTKAWSSRWYAQGRDYAQMLNDDQLDALAIYLATQKPAPPEKPKQSSRKK